MSSAQNDRRFTDDEVREILKKAVERSSSGAVMKREGVSLSELKAIAEEVGIDPAEVENAARSVTSPKTARQSGLFGAPTVVHRERRIGGEVAESEAAHALAIIRRTMGVPGSVAEVAGALEWSNEGEVSAQHVTVSSRDGHTTVTAGTNLSGAAILTYVPAGMVGLIATGIALHQTLDGSPAAPFFLFAILPVLITVLRVIFKNIAGSETEKLDRVVSELSEWVESSAD